MTDYDFMPAVPLWFASSNSTLLAELFHAELRIISRLLEESPELPELFDSPESTVTQRRACFALLAHRKLISMIDDQFVSFYAQSPALDEVESRAVQRTANLVPADAPSWALEMHKILELLPERMLRAMPKALQGQGWYTNDPEKDEAIRLAALEFSTVEKIQALTERIIDQQWQRFAARWPPAHDDVTRQQKRKSTRKRDKRRAARDRQIAEIDDVAETTIEFLQIMDERSIKPQPTWSGWPGSWRQAYKNPRLRKLIHQDKSRAIARARIHKK